MSHRTVTLVRGETPEHIRSAVTRAGDRAKDQLAAVQDRARPVWEARVRPAIATLTPGGGAVLLVAVLCWVLAWRFGWVEMSVIALAFLVLLALAAAFMIGTTHLVVTTVVEPPRVTVGEPLTGELTVRNGGRAPLLSTGVEFPIGTGGVYVDLPALLPGKEHRELFVIPTDRRGVIDVGPVSSVRGDPLGLFRRELRWTERAQVFVHPRITALEPLGVGLIRDLEGNSAQNLSVSDLAFHALREYVPGDDLRHIHWRSSARHGSLLVRQFLDTRRSHLVAIVDSNPEAYLSEDDYEVALSVAASLLVRALREEYDVSFLSGEVATTRQTGRPALDGCARAVPGPTSIIDVAVRGSRIAADASLAVLVTGPHSSYTSLQRAASQFGVETSRVAVRVDSGASAGLRTSATLPVLTISRLDELGGVLRWGVS